MDERSGDAGRSASEDDHVNHIIDWMAADTQECPATSCLASTTGRLPRTTGAIDRLLRFFFLSIGSFIRRFHTAPLDLEAIAPFPRHPAATTHPPAVKSGELLHRGRIRSDSAGKMVQLWDRRL
ncbi:hypothetical protein MTO96_037895 [Rhipicephalus appendiculatus]